MLKTILAFIGVITVVHWFFSPRPCICEQKQSDNISKETLHPVETKSGIDAILSNPEAVELLGAILLGPKKIEGLRQKAKESKRA